MSRIQEALIKTRRDSKSERRPKDEAAGGWPDIEPVGLDFASIRTLTPDRDHMVEKHIVAIQDDAPARSIFKVLRTRILQRMRSSNWNVLGVTGSGPGEGKTLTALNLAFSLSHDVNHKVVLVDLDLRRPAVHAALGVDPKYDLGSYIAGRSDLKTSLFRPDEQRLAILPNLTLYRDSSEVLSSPTIVNLIQELRALGPKTIIIVDLPPVLAGDDVLAFSPLIDALLLVVAEGVCKRQNLLGMHELLKEIEVIGTVLNRSREMSSSMDYYGYY